MSCGKTKDLGASVLAVIKKIKQKLHSVHQYFLLMYEICFLKVLFNVRIQIEKILVELTRKTGVFRRAGERT